jgi:hypothetical protein
MEGIYKLIITPPIEAIDNGNSVAVSSGTTTFKIFNTKLNPTFREDGNCDEVEACHNLYGLDRSFTY